MFGFGRVYIHKTEFKNQARICRVANLQFPFWNLSSTLERRDFSLGCGLQRVNPSVPIRIFANGNPRKGFENRNSSRFRSNIDGTPQKNNILKIKLVESAKHRVKMILVEYVWSACIDWLLVHSWYSQKEKASPSWDRHRQLIDFWGIWCTSSGQQKGPRLFEDWSPKRQPLNLPLKTRMNWRMVTSYQQPTGQAAKWYPPPSRPSC